MNKQFIFEAEPFELDSEVDEYEEEQPDVYSEFDEGESFDPEMGGGWLGEVTGFKPTGVEIPGGGRIKDKTPPKLTDLVTVTGVGSRRIQLHRLAAEAWQAVVSAARADGIQGPLLLPVSGYRSPATQERLWRNALKKYGSPQEARKWVAPPGGSAHQTGRAIDFYIGGKNSSANVARLRTLPAYKWLAANAGRFGFYSYLREPWHWEYNPPAAVQSEVYPESYETIELRNGYEDEGVDSYQESDESSESGDPYEAEGETEMFDEYQEEHPDIYSEFDEQYESDFESEPFETYSGLDEYEEEFPVRRRPVRAASMSGSPTKKTSFRYVKDFSGPATECAAALKRAGKTRTEALTIINAQIGVAIAMLRKAVTHLKRGSRSSGTTALFLRIFRVRPEFVPTWFKPTATIKDRGDVVATRCKRVADLLASGRIKYFCTINSTNCPDCGNDPSDFACSSWGDESVVPGRSNVVCLGNAFWDDMKAGKTSSLLATLMHEPFHIYYGRYVTAHRSDAGKFGGINCIVKFVFEINGRTAPARVNERCKDMAVRKELDEFLS